jgi:hypothetical protein
MTALQILRNSSSASEAAATEQADDAVATPRSTKGKRTLSVFCRSSTAPLYHSKDTWQGPLGTARIELCRVVP